MPRASTLDKHCLWKGLFCLLSLLALSCTSNHTDACRHQVATPSSFDSLPFIPQGEELDCRRIALGRELFFDAALSSDGSVSCASCHKPEFAFADTLAVSAGVHGRLDVRNSPSLINVAYQKKLFREGGIPSLEAQVLAPFGNESEMNISLSEAMEHLEHHDDYPRMAREAYGEEMSPMVMARALAAYQRSLISAGSIYDAYLAGDSAALSLSAKKGMALFFSERTACSDCHSGFLFTDQGFHNVGLYSEYRDHGRERITQKAEDIGKMKTPSLRNVALTPPYMHDGSLRSLEEVIDHFDSGGKGHPAQSTKVRPLSLSAEEKSDLKAFLISLSDTIYARSIIELQAVMP